MTPAATLNILVMANASQAIATLTKTQGALKATTAQAAATSNAIGTKLGAAAKLGGKIVGGTLAYGMYKGVKAGIDFEKQLDALGAVANATEKEMSKLEKQALKLGASTTFSATEAAAAQTELAKGGLKVKDIMGGALKSSLDLAAAGELDLALAAETTVNAMKLFDLGGKDSAKIADMLATAANKTTADVDDFAMALKQGGAVAKQAGLDMNQTVTILEAMAEAGQKNSDAGTSMKAAFLQLLNPTEKQTALTEALNIEWLTAQGEMKNVAGLSREVIDATKKMTEAERTKTLSILAGSDGFRALSALYDAGPEKLQKFAAANEKVGTAQEIAREKMDNTAGSLEQLGGSLETLGIQFFKAIGPTFRDMIDGASVGVQALAKILSDLPKTAEIVRKFFATNEDAKAFLDAIKNVAAAVKFAFEEVIGPIFAKALPGIKQFFSGVLRVAKGFIQFFSGVFTADFGKAWEGVKNILGGTLDQMLGMFEAILAPFKVAVGALGNLVKNILGGAFKAVKDIAAFAMDKMLGLVSSTLGAMADVIGKLAGLPILGDAFGDVADAARDAQGDIDSFRDKLRRDDAEKAETKVLNALGDAIDGVGDQFEKVSVKAIGFKRVAEIMAKDVARNAVGMVNTVADGLEVMGQNVKQALSAFGVDDIVLSIKKVAKATGFQQGGIVNAAKGAIVPGSSSGDTHPLHIDGRLAAFVESGELVSVTNRTATARQMAYNAAVPRRASGGIVQKLAAGGVAEPPGDPGSEVVQAAYAQAVGKFLGAYGMDLTQGYDPTGPSVSPGHLSLSAPPSLDVVPLDGNWDGAFAQGLKWALGQGMQVGYDGQYGTQAWSGHGEGNHAHIDWLGSAGKIGAMVEKIQRVVLEGPDGPLKSTGQGALDMARNAANKFIASKTPGPEGAEAGVSGGAYKGPLDKVFPHWTSLASPGIQLSTGQTGSLMAKAGLPSIFNEVAWRESGRHPGIMGTDPGGTRGLGMWMITTGFNDALIASMGGEDQMANPWINALAAKKLYDQGGLQPWAPSGPYQHGGIVQMLAEGGTVATSALPGIPFELVSELKRIAASANRTEIFGDLMGQVNAIADLEGFGPSGQLQNVFKTLREDADRFGQNASLAAQLTITEDFGDPDNPDDDIAAKLGVFQGLNEFDWLTKQLADLFELRNRIVGAQGRIKDWRDSVKKVEEVAKKQLREYEELVRVAENKLQEKGVLPDKWKGPNPLGDVRAWNKLDDKKREKQGKKFLKEGGKLPGSRKFLKDMTLATSTSAPNLFPNITGYRAVTTSLANTLIPALGEEGSALGDALRTAYSELDSIQGSHQNEFLNHLDVIPADIGSLGGEIFNVRLAMQGFDPTAGAGTPLTPAVDTSIADELARLHEAADLDLARAFALSQSQYKVFQDFGAFDSDFAGLFAKGGSIPSGMWGIAGERGAEVVHGPASVYSAADSRQMLGAPPVVSVAVIVEPGAGVDPEMIRVEVDGQIQRHDRQSARVGRVRSYS